MEAVTAPGGRGKHFRNQETPVLPASEALTYSKMSLTRLCSILMALCWAIRCSATGEVRPRVRRGGHTVPPTLKEAPAATLTSGVLSTACCGHSRHVVHTNAFRFLCGQSVGQLSKEHGGLWGTRSQKQETQGRAVGAEGLGITYLSIDYIYD